MSTTGLNGFAYDLGYSIAVLGQPGQGKSVLLHNLYHLAPSAVVYGIVREPGFLLLSDAYVKTVAALARAFHQGYRHIYYLASTRAIADQDLMRADYDRVLSFCYKRGNMIMLCDELGSVTEQEVGGGRATRIMRLVGKLGRHQKFTHAFASQRNQDLPMSIVSNATNKCVYRLDGYDIDAYRKFLGKDFNSRMAQLPKYGFLWFHLGEVQACAPVPVLVDEDKDHFKIHVETNAPVEVL